MIDYQDIRDTLVGGLNGFTGKLVILSNSTAPRPPYPFLTYHFIAPFIPGPGQPIFLHQDYENPDQVTQEAVAATGLVAFAGDNGTVIPQGTLVETPGGVQFTTDGEAIVAVGMALAWVTAVVPGAEGNVDAGTVTVIPVPVAGISSVTNTNPMAGGLDEETTPPQWEYDVKETRLTHDSLTVSIMAHGEDPDVVVALALQAHSWFDYYGRQALREAGIVVIRLHPVENRDDLVVDSYEYRSGFDGEIVVPSGLVMLKPTIERVEIGD